MFEAKPVCDTYTKSNLVRQTFCRVMVDEVGICKRPRRQPGRFKANSVRYGPALPYFVELELNSADLTHLHSSTSPFLLINNHTSDMAPNPISTTSQLNLPSPVR